MADGWWISNYFWLLCVFEQFSSFELIWFNWNYFSNYRQHFDYESSVNGDSNWTNTGYYGLRLCNFIMIVLLNHFYHWLWYAVSVCKNRISNCILSWLKKTSTVLTFLRQNISNLRLLCQPDIPRYKLNQQFHVRTHFLNKLVQFAMELKPQTQHNILPYFAYLRLKFTSYFSYAALYAINRSLQFKFDSIRNKITCVRVCNFHNPLRIYHKNCYLLKYYMYEHWT